MIIASKGHIRMKGKGEEVLAEFVTISASLMEDVELTPEQLKAAIDIAYIAKENAKNEHTSN